MLEQSWDYHSNKIINTNINIIINTISIILKQNKLNIIYNKKKGLRIALSFYLQLNIF
ncbi:hypothetical protein XBI1_2040023 [Xenorhabdus bovienii str. Intermedium]|uniref:Uncharacterized protein n=1 Tax=Xenorhabdus bovienii str. Intermedium TaxID=1379677 RepID=A0A077Q8Q2_XENBV|nr:hypothetical protein XBI1_2040023 [Xenorhabdus bovienii str. Intermedium]